MKANRPSMPNNATFEDICRCFASARPLKQGSDSDRFETLTLRSGRLGTPAPTLSPSIPRPMFDARIRSARKYLTLNEKAQEIYAAAHREHGEILQEIREDILKKRPKPSQLFKFYYSIDDLNRCKEGRTQALHGGRKESDTVLRLAIVGRDLMLAKENYDMSVKQRDFARRAKQSDELTADDYCKYFWLGNLDMLTVQSATEGPYLSSVLAQHTVDLRTSSAFQLATIGRSAYGDPSKPCPEAVEHTLEEVDCYDPRETKSAGASTRRRITLRDVVAAAGPELVAQAAARSEQTAAAAQAAAAEPGRQGRQRQAQPEVGAAHAGMAATSESESEDGVPADDLSPTAPLHPASVQQANPARLPPKRGRFQQQRRPVPRVAAAVAAPLLPELSSCRPLPAPDLGKRALTTLARLSDTTYPITVTLPDYLHLLSDFIERNRNNGYLRRVTQLHDVGAADVKPTDCWLNLSGTQSLYFVRADGVEVYHGVHPPHMRDSRRSVPKEYRREYLKVFDRFGISADAVEMGH
jgi:hypothetical protein